MDEVIENLHLKGKNKKTAEEVHQKLIAHTKTSLGNKKLHLNEINSNNSWGREHCEYCFKDLSKGEEAYTEEEEKYWLCKDCYTKHKDELNLKS